MTDEAEETHENDANSQDSIGKIVQGVLDVFEAQNIPHAEFTGGGMFNDFWQDGSPVLPCPAATIGQTDNPATGDINSSVNHQQHFFVKNEPQFGRSLDSNCVLPPSLSYESRRSSVESNIVNRHGAVVKNDPHYGRYLDSDSGYIQPFSNESRRSSVESNTGHVTTSSQVTNRAMMYEIPAEPVTVNPPRTSFPGDFNFQITFEQRDSVPKSANCTYSPVLNKLFAKQNVPCPVQFTSEIPPPPGTIVRAMLVYQNTEHLHETVGRCQNHLVMDSSKGEVANHVLQVCHAQNAHYDSSRGRFSIVVPFQAAFPGTEAFVVQYSFSCLSTCIGGINRRPLLAVFTLESEQGLPLGRVSIGIKVCSCPGRDRPKEEERRRKRGMPSPVNVPVPLPKKRAMRPENTPGASGFRFLRVREENYAILSQLNDALNLARLATEQQRADYEENEQKDRWSELLAKFCKDTFH